MKKPKNQTKQKIMDAVKNEEVKIKSHILLLFEDIALAFFIAIAGIVMIVLIGMVVFWIRMNIDFFAPSMYGMMGPNIALRAFPYGLFLSAFFLFIVFILLLRRFDISYRLPFAIGIGIIATVIIFTSLLTVQAPWGRSFYMHGAQVMHFEGGKNRRFVYGTVVDINAKRLKVNALGKREYSVEYTQKTDIINNKLKKGTTIRAIGVWKGNVLYADRIIVFKPFEGQMMMQMRDRMSQFHDEGR